MKSTRIVAASLAFLPALAGALLSLGCSRGYVAPQDLERQNQGPTACAERCTELGMRMGALVLVSNTTPACVCEPVQTFGDSGSIEGGAGSASGHVVIVAAAAQRAQQLQQQQRNATTSTGR